MPLPADVPFVLSEHARVVLLERRIDREWVRATLADPQRTEVDKDDAALCHALRGIEDFGGRVLRVVYNLTETPTLVVTAYFDRSMRGKL